MQKKKRPDPILCAGSAEDCAADQVWCWAQCYSVAHLPCGTDATCWDPRENQPWSGNVLDHCTTCSLQCIAPPPPPHTPGVTHHATSADQRVPFCYGPGTTMHMSGFEFGPNVCVVWLFKDWVLDSSVKYTFSIIGTLLLASIPELLKWLRRVKMHSKASAFKGRARMHHVAHSATFGCQVMLGYALMLITMTYQFELFLAVVVGITLSHALFTSHCESDPSVDDGACVMCTPGPSGAQQPRAMANGDLVTDLVDNENCAEPVMGTPCIDAI